MDPNWSWVTLAASVLLICGYELRLWVTDRSNPQSSARAAHAALREEWVSVLSAQSGSEITAVQTLRNSLMSATISALAKISGMCAGVTRASPSQRIASITRLSV